MRSELKTLKEFKETHLHCAKQSSSHHETLTKVGAGCDGEIESSIDDCEQEKVCSCNNGDSSFNDNLNTVLHQEAPTTEISNDTSTDESAEFPHSLILSKIWKRHHFKASRILDELKKSGRFSIDKNSMVSIDSKPLHESVFQLMKVAFQPVKKDLSKYHVFAELLKELNLENFISNKYLLVKDHHPSVNLSSYWYYIGE